MLLLPPSALAARLTSDVFRKSFLTGLPELEATNPESKLSRRGFMGAAALGLWAFSECAQAREPGPLVFDREADALSESRSNQQNNSRYERAEVLRRGEIPVDFWSKPRELWLRRQGTADEIRVVYWKDGNLIPEGYWQACALLRDVRANVMTTIDPTLLDVLRGISGYYQAWAWPHPVTATSGYRTVRTNDALSREGAAKNSMHLYGKAVDLHIPGIPTRDVSALGMYLQQGGVGFYPDRNFTHLDTGKLRVWRGR